MHTQKTLPPAFKELEEHLDWALPTEAARLGYREGRSMEQIREFYDAILPHAPAILEHFRAAEAASGAPDKVDEETKTLFTLMLAFSCASLSIEMHKSPTVPHGIPWDVWKPEHETAGWRNKPKSRLFPKMAASGPQ